jgi:hypothetical protein
MGKLDLEYKDMGKYSQSQQKNSDLNELRQNDSIHVDY